MAGGDSKTEKASPKKRRDERKKGNIFQSKDIVTVVSVLVIFQFMRLYFPIIYDKIYIIILRYINYIPTIRVITPEFLVDLAWDCILTFFICALPVAFIAVLVAIVATGAQTGFLFSAENMRFKFERLDPIKGIGKMFSLRSVVEIVKGSIKITVIGYILINFIKDKLVYFSRLFDTDIVQATGFLMQSIMDMVMKIVLVFIFIAGFDLFYQWWDYERQIKMSKHDVKEEYKQMEGDPQVKGKIKEKQRKIAMSRMMQAVPTADVIIRNPTHFAVALKYDIDKDNAPVIVAMGKDNMALKIIEVAQQNGIYVAEDKPLARAIYAAGQLGREIPYEHFAAVAQILAVVFTLREQVED